MSHVLRRPARCPGPPLTLLDTHSAQQARPTQQSVRQGPTSHSQTQLDWFPLPEIQTVDLQHRSAHLIPLKPMGVPSKVHDHSSRENAFWNCGVTHSSIVAARFELETLGTAETTAPTTSIWARTGSCSPPRQTRVTRPAPPQSPPAAAGRPGPRRRRGSWRTPHHPASAGHPPSCGACHPLSRARRCQNWTQPRGCVG